MSTLTTISLLALTLRSVYVQNYLPRLHGDEFPLPMSRYFARKVRERGTQKHL